MEPTTPHGSSSQASPHGAPQPRTTTRHDVRKVAFASGLGNAIELYDFIIYGMASAIVFNQLFFATEDKLLGTLFSFIIMGAGFLPRPLGGLVFGHFGDRLGRKAMLVITLTATGICTALIGLLPTWSTAGVFAPLALLTLRILQGFFMGGEQGGAFVMITEHAPRGTKAFYGGWATSGSPIGAILGTLVFTFVSTATGPAFLEWGWRLPFLFSIVLVGVGIYIRLRLDESPEFAHIKAAEATSPAPIREVLSTAGLLVLAGIVLNMGFNLTIFVINSFSLAYGTEVLGISRDDMLLAGLLGAIAHLIAVLASAKLADVYGLNRVMGLGAGLMIAFAFPFFMIFDLGTPLAAIIAVVGGYACAGVIWGPMAFWFTNLFKPRNRYSGVSVSFQLGAVLGGGLSPTIATALLKSTGASWPISLYLVCGGVLAVLGLWLGRKRAAEV